MCAFIYDGSRIVSPLLFTVCELFTGETCRTLSLTFRMNQGQITTYQSDGSMRLSIFWQYDMANTAIAVLAMSVTVCEVFTYEVRNVLDSHRMVNDVDDFDENLRTYFVNMFIRLSKLALLGSAVCSRLHLARHFSACARTDVRVVVLTCTICDNTPPLHFVETCKHRTCENTA